ncbi:MAG: FAD-dependent oxidoreductase [bacterium]|nr:FAD-dependent oxidoreductase [bacterium]
MTNKVVDVDFLILGSGISGLYTAYLLADHGKTMIVTKSKMEHASTSWAQGGIASVLTDEDSFESHIEDTLNAGAGLCDPEAVRVLVTEGPEHVRKLIELGARFERDDEGELHLGREGGHSQNRIVHAADLTGHEVEKVLLESVRKKGVPIIEHSSAVEIITRFHLKDPAAAAPGAKLPDWSGAASSSDQAANDSPDAQVAAEWPAPDNDSTRANSHCYGAYIYDRQTWDITIVRAKATVLGTGGAGQVYLHNTNPTVSTGDGVALAYRAGAEVSDMEFYQFHPTSLYDPESERTFLITEALRGFGGILRGADREPFMEKYDPRKDLAPRDIVARAIDAELKRSALQHVWLDVRHKSREELMEHFPNIFSYCLDRGIDISRDMIPVVPAAHYMCGGVQTDLHGRTCIQGLFALGEVSCTGVHGGNRLASNSLLEGLVFAARIAEYLKANPAQYTVPEIREWQKEGLANADEWILVQHDFEEIKKVMWDYVGIVRSDLRLHRARRRIQLLHDEIRDFYRRTVIQNKILELRNLALVARLMVDSALSRTESRGLHYSTDYPEDREPSSKHTTLRRTGPEI